MTWIKICGVTNLEDARAAVDAGADALGFVFYEKSPRYVEPKAARKIVAALPLTIEKVGVFVNQTAASICAVADEVDLSGVQLHGDDEDPRVADLLIERRPRLKVFAGILMNDPHAKNAAMRWNARLVHAFLLDSGHGGQFGGSGKTFDWGASGAIAEAIKSLGRVIVAGGLKPSNVAEAIGILKPWGVDVSSGVEAAPGKKDPEKVRAFVAAARKADAETRELEIPRRSRSSE